MFDNDLTELARASRFSGTLLGLIDALNVLEARVLQTPGCEDEREHLAMLGPRIAGLIESIAEKTVRPVPAPVTVVTEPPGAKVIDLMAALQDSLAAAKARNRA